MQHLFKLKRYNCSTYCWLRVTILRLDQSKSWVAPNRSFSFIHQHVNCSGDVCVPKQLHQFSTQIVIAEVFHYERALSSTIAWPARKQRERILTRNIFRTPATVHTSCRSDRIHFGKVSVVVYIFPAQTNRGRTTVLRGNERGEKKPPTRDRVDL